jgi:hypothetical protein
MVCEEDHRRIIKYFTSGDHFQGQSLDVVHEVKGHCVRGIDEVPEIN